MIARLLVFAILGLLIGMAVKHILKKPKVEIENSAEDTDSNLESCPVCEVYMPEGSRTKCGRDDCPY